MHAGRIVVLVMIGLTMNGCSDAKVLVSDMFSRTRTSGPPGFSVDAPTGTLTGGGMVLKARVSSVSGSTLSGGGMTLTHGRVQ